MRSPGHGGGTGSITPDIVGRAPRAVPPPKVDPPDSWQTGTARAGDTGPVRADLGSDRLPLAARRSAVAVRLEPVIRHVKQLLTRLRSLRRPNARGAVRAHPGLAVGAILALALVVVGSAGLVLLTLGSSAQPAPPAVTFTYGSTWTLLDLQRHIEAGEVVAVSTPSGPADANGGGPSDANADPDTLVAKLADGVPGVPVTSGRGR